MTAQALRTEVHRLETRVPMVTTYALARHPERAVTLCDAHADDPDRGLGEVRYGARPGACDDCRLAERLEPAHCALGSYKCDRCYFEWTRQQERTADEEETAEARVRAAAPELLAACEELSAWLRARTGPGDGTAQMLTRALGATAKATGRTE